MIKKMKQFRLKWHQDIVDKVKPFFYSEETYLTNLMSFTSNDILLRQGTADKTSEYEYYHELHRLLCINRIDECTYNLVRIGRDYDGGYVVVRKKADGSFSDNNIAYSLGICDDVSFDIALAEQNYEIYQYDHTIDNLPQENEKFHWRKTGITGSNETEQLKSLLTVLKNDGNDSRNGMFLKCDIEGSEWDMLNDCTDFILNKFDQIVIELHYLTDFHNRETILKTLEKLTATHQAVHIHANNNSIVNYCDTLVTPSVIEVTFVLKEKYATTKADIILPTKLDQPCNLSYPDILPGRWNVIS